MNARFRLICVAVLVMLAGYTGAANGQIITISTTQYKAAAGGNPATAEPKGTWSLPGTGKAYKVVVDYGYIDKGVYTPDANVSKGGEGQPGVVTKVGGGHNGNWSSKAAHTLTNPKAGLHARARIQESANGVDFTDVVGAVTYAPLPIPVQPPPPPPPIEDTARLQVPSRRGARRCRGLRGGRQRTRTSITLLWR